MFVVSATTGGCDSGAGGAVCCDENCGVGADDLVRRLDSGSMLDLAGR